MGASEACQGLGRHEKHVTSQNALNLIIVITENIKSNYSKDEKEVEEALDNIIDICRQALNDKCRTN